MITKHTPGPWEVGNETKGKSPFMVYCNDATGQRIADCRNEFVSHSNEEKKANARLIAAAPKMLAALKWAAAHAAESEAEKDERWWGTYYTLGIIIAEAEGL